MNLVWMVKKKKESSLGSPFNLKFNHFTQVQFCRTIQSVDIYFVHNLFLITIRFDFIKNIAFILFHRSFVLKAPTL